MILILRKIRSQAEKMNRKHRSQVKRMIRVKNQKKIQIRIKRKSALTFDDGPHPTNTLEILELLDKHDAKATFFMLGNRVDFYPDIAKVIAEKGHELGNHTWTHKDLTTLGQEEISEEVAVTMK